MAADLSRPDTLPPAVDAMTVLVASVVVHDETTDRVVLLQRGPGGKWGHGLWDVPTGKREPGEPITTTAVRELHEETGLVVKPESLRVAHLLHSARGAACPDGFLTVAFATTEWSGTPENREPAKHAQVRWADLSDLPGGFVPSTAHILRADRAGEGAVTRHRGG
jgi:8-oxo-dGTP pyrophosphatase MutT (NUDIX family)